jgi:hypothetical protein
MEKSKYNQATELLRQIEVLQIKINYLDARLKEKGVSNSSQYDHWIEGIYYALFEQDLDLDEEDFIINVVQQIKSNYQSKVNELQEKFKKL